MHYKPHKGWLRDRKSVCVLWHFLHPLIWRRSTLKILEVEGLCVFQCFRRVYHLLTFSATKATHEKKEKKEKDRKEREHPLLSFVLNKDVSLCHAAACDQSRRRKNSPVQTAPCRLLTNDLIWRLIGWYFVSVEGEAAGAPECKRGFCPVDF